MIALLKMGKYRLIETKTNTKVLYLDENSYAWVEPLEIGEILVVSHNPHKTDCVLSVGHYRLYDVTDEADISDHQHMELETGLDLTMERVGAWSWTAAARRVESAMLASIRQDCESRCRRQTGSAPVR